jgi:hypothetical protein
LLKICAGFAKQRAVSCSAELILALIIKPFPDPSPFP